MTTATLDPPTVKQTPASKLGTAIDAARQAAHVSHEVKLLKTLASDAAEDAVYAAKRTATIVQRRALDARDAAVYRVKRYPIQSMLITFGVGLVFGAVVRRTYSRVTRKEREESAGCP